MPQAPPNDLRPPEAHNILIIPSIGTDTIPGTDLRKMMIMELQEDGSYKSSATVEPTGEGGRKLYNIARPAGQAPRGPAFSVLPIRPDPGTSFGTSFLINTDNLWLPNPWTASDWDAFVAGSTSDRLIGNVDANPIPDDGRGYATTWLDDKFEVLLAGPQGKVYHVACDADGIPRGEEISLEGEVEIWAQLREGCIVGTVMWNKGKRVLPILNVTCLKLPAEAPEGGTP